MRDSERPFLENVVHRAYAWLIWPLVKDPLARQRIKLLWYACGYWPVLIGLKRQSLGERVRLLARFLRIDWHVVHGHTPYEVARLAVAIDRQEKGTGNFVEAGCWNGGSSAKFSLLCALYGCRLYIYDSFQGVEDVSRLKGEWDYSGQYAAPQATLQSNLQRFGDSKVCVICPGWFADTLAVHGAPNPVRLAYIDCDIAKGTREALSGIVPALSDDGVIFSQDFHIAPVQKLLRDPQTWVSLGKPVPQIHQFDRRLAQFFW